MKVQNDDVNVPEYQSSGVTRYRVTAGVWVHERVRGLVYGRLMRVCTPRSLGVTEAGRVNDTSSPKINPRISTAELHSVVSRP